MNITLYENSLLVSLVKDSRTRDERGLAKSDQCPKCGL